MSTHTAPSTCPICGEEINNNTKAVFVALVEAVHTSTSGHFGGRAVPMDKMRVNHLSPVLQPKNLIHVECWNYMLQNGAEGNAEFLLEVDIACLEQ